MADTLLEQIGDDLEGAYDDVFGFAEDVTGPSGVIRGVFTKEYYQGDTGGPVIVSLSQPVLRTRDADALEQGDSVTIRTVAYAVVEVQPNGFGETLHRLRAA